MRTVTFHSLGHVQVLGDVQFPPLPHVCEQVVLSNLFRTSRGHMCMCCCANTTMQTILHAVVLSSRTSPAWNSASCIWRHTYVSAGIGPMITDRRMASRSLHQAIRRTATNIVCDADTPSRKLSHMMLIHHISHDFAYLLCKNVLIRKILSDRP